MLETNKTAITVTLLEVWPSFGQDVSMNVYCENSIIGSQGVVSLEISVKKINMIFHTCQVVKTCQVWILKF
jgi:hypothetical protein